MKLLVGVYNCEHEMEILNDWKDWTSIAVDPPNIDEDDDLDSVSYSSNEICLFARFWLTKMKTKHQQRRLHDGSSIYKTV
jgi:hypothetical protein